MFLGGEQDARGGHRGGAQGAAQGEGRPPEAAGRTRQGGVQISLSFQLFAVVS